MCKDDRKNDLTEEEKIENKNRNFQKGKIYELLCDALFQIYWTFDLQRWKIIVGTA